MELNEEYNAEQALFQMARMKRYPLSGVLELTPLCNMKCNMCYVRLSKKEMDQKGKLISAKEWLHLASQMRNAGTLFILLTGGEPLMHPEFKDIYLGLKEMRMIITINSNGTLIDKNWAEFFKKYKPRRINITLYGTDSKTYNDICHFPDGYQRTIDAIQLLRSYGVDVKISVSLVPENMNSIEKFYKIGKELDAPVKMSDYMFPSLRERDTVSITEHRLSPKQMAEARLRIFTVEHSQQLFMEEAKAILQEIESKQSLNRDDSDIKCYAGNCSFVINWQGKMRPCLMLSYPEKDVLKSNFIDCWESIVDKTNCLKLDPKCHNCNRKILCPTCIAAQQAENGNFGTAPSYLCEFTKEYKKIIEDTYFSLLHLQNSK